MHAKSLQSCLTLCDPMDCSLPGSSVGFSKREYWSRLPFPSPGDLSDSGIEPHLLHLCIGRQVLYHYHHLRSPLLPKRSKQITLHMKERCQLIENGTILYAMLCEVKVKCPEVLPPLSCRPLADSNRPGEPRKIHKGWEPSGKLPRSPAR